MRLKARTYFIRFCVLCSLYHLFTVFDDYFRREVNEFISMDVSKEIEVPTLSVCFEVIDFVAFRDYVEKNYNLSFDQETLYISYYTPLDGKLTLRQLYNLLPKNDSIFKYVRISPKFFNGIWLKPKVQIHPYFFEPFYCFAIGVRDEKPYRVDWNDISIADYGGTILGVSLNLEAISRHATIFLFTHPHKTLIHEATLGVQRVSLIELKNNCEFSYEKVKYNLLPYPYKTNCLNYKNIGYKTRSEAIDICIQALARKEFNRSLPFSSASVESESYIGFGFIYKILVNITILNKLRNIKKICGQQYYKPDCELTYFKLSNCWIFDGVSDNLNLKMKVMNRPYIEVFSRETVTISQSIIYFASILGLWFGFSIAFDVPKALKFASHRFCGNTVKPKENVSILPSYLRTPYLINDEWLKENLSHPNGLNLNIFYRRN